MTGLVVSTYIAKTVFIIVGLVLVAPKRWDLKGKFNKYLWNGEN